MFLTAPGTDPFKMNQMDKTLKSNLQAQSSSLKQKIFKTMHVRKLYIIENSLNCRMKYSRTPFYAAIKIIHNWFSAAQHISVFYFKMADSVKDIFQLAKIQLSPLPFLES
jgi:hypothetical protein